MYAAEEGIWPEFSIDGVGADFTRRHSPPLGTSGSPVVDF